MVSATRSAVRLLTPLAVVFALSACGDDPVSSEPDVVDVQVTATSSTLTSIGATQSLTAVALDANGDEVAGVTFSWTSSDDDVASVSASGVVTAVGEGTAQITAETNGVSGTTTITVDVPVAEVVLTAEVTTIQVGGSTTIDVVATGPDGNELPLSTFTWASSAETVATVDGEGTVTAEGPGTAMITAESEGVSASVEITVTGAVASIELVPNDAELVSVGETTEVVATVKDDEGGILDGILLSWSSSDETVATVDDDGTVTAQGEGEATITAEFGAISGMTTITVALEVAAVVVTPDPAAVEVGSTTQLSASAEDANGNPIDDATFTWTSDTEAVATVDGTGLVSGEAEGTATITATSEGVDGTATVTVSAAAMLTLALVAGDAQTDGRTEEAFGEALTVEVTDNLGAPVEGVVVDWAITGDASLSATSSTTDASGQASVTVTGGITTGDISVEATSTAAAGGPITFSLETTVMVVEIVDNAFVDLQGRTNADFEVDVRVGDTIEWQYVEAGTLVHTVTSTAEPTGGATFASGNLNPGDTFTFTPQVEGIWIFRCDIHPGLMMGATINVTAG